MKSIRTEVLEIFYEDEGPEQGSPILLLHGWPDAPRSWKKVAPRLHAEGWRTIIPFLRGFKPTRFLSETRPRFGSGVALAQDAIDLADALEFDRFAVVGHDWGARAAYILAALYPQRLAAIAALSVAYQPRGIFKVPDFAQSQRFWYQWFQCIGQGEEAVRRDPVGFARTQWDTWGPRGWFDEAEFAATAESFHDRDWAAITLNAYRGRWMPNEQTDPFYDSLRRELAEVELLSTPTLMIQGRSDFCDDPRQSETLDQFFTGGYQRLLFEGVGHFPHREAPDRVADALVQFLKAQNYQSMTAFKAAR